MIRRLKHADHSSHDRWLISYADFITLLFAFFVVMFASSETSKVKTRQVSESMGKAFGQSITPQSSKDDKPAPQAPQFADLLPSMRLLEKALSKELDSGKVRLSLEARGLVITLGEAGFFAAGDERVQPTAYGTLSKVAGSLTTIPNPIRLEGHSDATPIHSPRFDSNWELSAARAVQVLKALEDQFQIGRSRLSAAGYADTVPLDSNETETGRAKNRRVNIVVLSSGGAKAIF